MTHDFDEQPYCEEYESGMRCLSEYFGLPADNANYELISHRAYKYTDCGMWIEISDSGIRLGSIVEGCDHFGTEIFPLKWKDVTHDAISDRIAAIEEQASAIWVWANETDQECDCPYFPEHQHLGPDGFSS